MTKILLIVICLANHLHLLTAQVLEGRSQRNLWIWLLGIWYAIFCALYSGILLIQSVETKLLTSRSHRMLLFIACFINI